MGFKEKQKFKQSEIGLIPKDWEVKEIGEISSYINRGIAPKYSQKGFPVLNQKCVRNGKLEHVDIKFHSSKESFPKEKIVVKDDILINSTGVGTLGRAANVKSKISGLVLADSHLTIVRIDQTKADPWFVSYYLNSIQSRIEDMGEGTSGQQELSRKLVKTIKIPFPNITQQKLISQLLSDLDEKIELNQQMNRSLEAVGEAVFRRWFVDFEFPNEEGKPYKSSGGEMGASDLGEIPKEWSVGKYSDLVEIFTGKGLSREHLTEDGKYPVLGANGELGRTNEFLFDEELILTGRVGTLGQVYLITGKVWISDNVLISKPRSKENHHYAFFVLKSFDMESLNRGSTQPLVTQTDLKNQTLILPDKNILTKFERIVGSFYNRIEKNNLQNNCLSQIRDVLLPKLMSGKIRVPVTKEKVEAS